MLTTIIYRSHISDDFPIRTLPAMVDNASKINAAHDVTGILLFNGTHFFNYLRVRKRAFRQSIREFVQIDGTTMWWS